MDFTLEVLEQAPHRRIRVEGEPLIHRGDRGSQYVPVCYTDRLHDAGMQPSAGRVGDSYDNDLVKTDQRAVQGRGNPPRNVVA
jgi:putative transposase